MKSTLDQPSERKAASAPTSLQVMRKTAHSALKSTEYRLHWHLGKSTTDSEYSVVDGVLST